MAPGGDLAAETTEPTAAPEPDDAALSDLVARARRILAEQPAAPAAPPADAGARPVAAAAAADPATRPTPDAPLAPRLQPGADRRVAIGADHGGTELKRVLVDLLDELGWEALDVGTHGTDAVDYPDFAVKVARAVARGEAWRGIMIDGVGIGSAMVANKVPGVRAATVYDEATAVSSREHNDANVLVLGSGQVNRGLARRLVRIWLATAFAGGRHQRRVQKIADLDRERSR